jgi:hypothetical protein
VEDIVANTVVSSSIALKETLDAIVQLNVLKKQHKRQKIRSRSAFAGKQKSRLAG